MILFFTYYLNNKSEWLCTIKQQTYCDVYINSSDGFKSMVDTRLKHHSIIFSLVWVIKLNSSLESMYASQYVLMCIEIFTVILGYVKI